MKHATSSDDEQEDAGVYKAKAFKEYGFFNESRAEIVDAWFANALDYLRLSI